MSYLDFAQNRKQHCRPGRSSLTQRMRSGSVALIALCAVATASASAADEPSRQVQGGSDVGMVIGSIVFSAVYLPLKVAYAAVGIPVAGLTSLITQGNDEIANEVFVSATQGDYFVTVSHLRNPGTLQFVGRTGPVYAEGLAHVSAPPPDASSIVCADLRSFRGVYFGSNDSKIGLRAGRQLDYVAAALGKCGDHELRIEGYTDSVGDTERNSELAAQRAEAVKGYLVGRGIDEDRLLAKGFADTSPAASNQTRAGRAQNRRAELPIVQ